MNKARHTIAKHQLDLTAETWPVCLLEFKRHLDRVKAGRILEVLVADPDVVDSVGKILQHSADRIIRIEKDKDRFRILIHREVSASQRA